MTKILVLNVGWSNKGNRALIISMIETINKYIENTEYIYVGPAPLKNDVIEIHQHAGYWISLKNPFLTLRSLFYLLESAIIGLFKRLNIKIKIPNSSLLSHYDHCDIVINSGGDSTSGEYGIEAIPALLNIAYANLMGIPVICYGESLGYFKNPFMNIIAKIIFNGTDMILVREKLSEKYLHDNHIFRPKIYLTADPAFLLTKSSVSRINEILRFEGIQIENPIIGINPSGLISRFRNKSNRSDIEVAQIYAKIIDHLTNKMNMNVILIPHVYSKGGDDRDSIKLILNYVEVKSKVQIIKGEYDAPELKGIIGMCDIFIGERMHATIASLSQNIPTIGIAYSHKMYGIVGEMLGQNKNIIDIKDLNYNILMSKIIDVWINKDQIRKEIEDRMAFIKEKAISNGMYVRELVKSLESENKLF